MLRPRFVERHLYYVVAGLALAALAHSSSAAEIIPYEARVVASGAPVHSGPGEKFYATDTLAQGDVVEVYKEKSGGWLAVRPPVNSFSWVAGHDLDMCEGGVAEVNKDDVASRIGSRLSEKHNAAQVRLKKGEAVEILDQEEVAGETWYKIAPPAGEFRWIQSSLVERVGPIQLASAESSTPIGTAVVDNSGDATAPPLIPTSTTQPAAAAAPASSTPAATNTPVAPPASASNWLPAGSSQSLPPSGVAPAAATGVMAASTTPGLAKPQANVGVADDLSRELATIELRLSRMVAAPVNLWNTERLERDAAQLASRARTPAERDAVQVTQTKIKQFATIAQRASQVPAGVAKTGQQPITPIAGAPATAGTAPAAGVAQTPGAIPTTVAANTAGGPYDAVGILRPVVSKRPGAPQFALVDDRGQVLSFVTPTPDMNLQPYLGRRVGVVGNRGFITEFNRSHVTAARVTPLSERVLR